MNLKKYPKCDSGFGVHRVEGKGILFTVSFKLQVQHSGCRNKTNNVRYTSLGIQKVHGFRLISL